MNKRKSVGWVVSLSVLAMMLVGCTPVKILDVVEIKPNETVWVIPLDAAGQSDQVKFNSVEFLNQKKVGSKRIMVDKVPRSIGRLWCDIEWIPAVRVIKVDRSLVTREWTDGSNTGTSVAREGIGVVTKDSVQLRIGLTITASIDEDDASTYLYYHGEKPLQDVMSQNIRSFAVAELTKEYSDLTLSSAQTNSTLIYNRLFEDAKVAFKSKGITIQYLGNAEGLEYSDPKVQDSINRSYTVQQDARTAQMEQEAQMIRNKTKILTMQAEAEAEQGAQEVKNKVTVETSEAQAKAALNLMAAKDATEFQNQLKIKLLEAEARMKMATTWNGQMPTSIIPSDSPLLMNLGTSPSPVK